MSLNTQGIKTLGTATLAACSTCTGELGPWILQCKWRDPLTRGASGSGRRGSGPLRPERENGLGP